MPAALCKRLFLSQWQRGGLVVTLIEQILNCMAVPNTCANSQIQAHAHRWFPHSQGGLSRALLITSPSRPPLLLSSSPPSQASKRLPHRSPTRICNHLAGLDVTVGLSAGRDPLSRLCIACPGTQGQLRLAGAQVPKQKKTRKKSVRDPQRDPHKVPGTSCSSGTCWDINLSRFCRRRRRRRHCRSIKAKGDPRSPLLPASPPLS